jgi:hypothetical protein
MFVLHMLRARFISLAENIIKVGVILEWFLMVVEEMVMTFIVVVGG